MSFSLLRLLFCLGNIRLRLDMKDTSWDSCLKVVPPPPISLEKKELTTENETQLAGYTNIRFYNAGYELIRDLLPKGARCEGWLNNEWCWAGQSSPAQRGVCHITICRTPNEIRAINAYCKITHLLDPIAHLQGKVTLQSDDVRATNKAKQKLNEPMNQAYVENIAYSYLSRLREKNLSPHFPYYYGAFTATAKTYVWNITDDINSYRRKKWFWKAIDMEQIHIRVEDSGSIGSRPSSLESETSSETHTTEELFDPELDALCVRTENVSIHTAKLSFHSEQPRTKEKKSLESEIENDTDEEDETDEEDDGDETDEEDDETPVYMDIPKFPVMLLYLEQFEGVMDDLVHHPEALEIENPTTAERETMWAAWIFQVIAALCTVQHLASLTHNDLHTNNVAWRNTDEPFLYYTRRNGTVWKVPTYGKIFVIIDFGRVIFRLQEKVLYSDDFCHGNYASTQYNFGPLRDLHRTEEVLPNPSFDLCRFATSLFETLFPEQPDPKPEGRILSAEPGLIVRETVSELFNVLWSWMVTDDGENVLVDADGDDKYPCFDLYEVIAKKCHHARPCDQVERAPFTQFRIQSLPSGVTTAYSLFF